MNSAADLRCLLMSVPGGQVLLPNSLVVEVLPFATPLRIETAPAWVVGAMLWRNLTTPLVSLGQWVFDTPPETDVNSRVIIVNTLGNDSHLPHFGILGTAAPRPLHLQPQDLSHDDQDDSAQPPRPGVLSWARYQGQRVAIPDMDAIEAVLQPLVRRA